MPWFKVDDKLHSHAKAIKAGEAMALWVVAGSWCSDQLTDGFVPDYMVERLMPGGLAMAERLVAAGLWFADEHRDDSGWRFHEWEDRNPTADEVEAKRDIARRRSAMNSNPQLAKAVKERDEGRCRYCESPVNWRDRKSPSGGTYDHVIPVSQGGDESFGNLVTACRKCNMQKGARTPEQAGMPLLPPRSDASRSSSRDQDGTTSGPRQPVPDPSPSRPNPSSTPKPEEEAATHDGQPHLDAVRRALPAPERRRLDVDVGHQRLCDALADLADVGWPPDAAAAGLTANPLDGAGSVAAVLATRARQLAASPPPDAQATAARCPPTCGCGGSGMVLDDDGAHPCPHRMAAA